MKFRSEIETAPLRMRFSYENRTLALGSCFAAHIAARLSRAKFRVEANPTGILFNPLSVAAAVRGFGRPVVRDELHTDGQRWFHFGFHGDFSAPTPDEALRRMNAARQAGSEALRTADRVILTFGTAWVYERQGGGAPWTRSPTRSRNWPKARWPGEASCSRSAPCATRATGLRETP